MPELSKFDLAVEKLLDLAADLEDHIEGLRAEEAAGIICECTEVIEFEIAGLNEDVKEYRALNLKSAKEIEELSAKAERLEAIEEASEDVTIIEMWMAECKRKDWIIKHKDAVIQAMAEKLDVYKGTVECLECFAHDTCEPDNGNCVDNIIIYFEEKVADK